MEARCFESDNFRKPILIRWRIDQACVFGSDSELLYKRHPGCYPRIGG